MVRLEVAAGSLLTDGTSKLSIKTAIRQAPLLESILMKLLYSILMELLYSILKRFEILSS